MRLHPVHASAVLVLNALLLDAEAAGPGPVLTQLEHAFAQGDAALLRATAPLEARVRVDLDELPAIHGSFGASQLAAVFARAFSGIETLNFEFEPDPGRTESGTYFARARWRRRPRGQEQPHIDTLTLVLAHQSGEWRLVELRSSP